MSDEKLKNFKKSKKFRSKKKKNKLVILFDEKARREFLTGFQKRKQERRNRAKLKLEEELKAERKRIKAQAKEQYKKLLLSQSKPLPELTGLFSENIDMGTHSVSVTELSAAELAKKNNWIGINEVQYQKPEEESNETENTSKEEDLEGMDLKRKKTKKKSEDDITSAKTCKEFKKKMKQQATKCVKNSAVFKKKARSDKVRSIKLKKRQEKLMKRLSKKQNKHKKSQSSFL